MSSRTTLVLAMLAALLVSPATAAPAVAAVPVGTTTQITSVDPPGGARVNQLVTVNVLVTAADGSVPVGTVHLDTGGCMSSLDSEAVGSDGTVTLTHAFTAAYDYSLNACFFPDDYDAYQSSADFSSYPVSTVATTTEITSVDPPGGAWVNQLVTVNVLVTAADGSVPDGTVHLDTGGCMSSLDSEAVGSDGTVTLTHTFTAAYDYSLNACFFPDDYDVYQSSADYSTYPVGPAATTTEITSVNPPGGAQVNQLVTVNVKVTAADGSVPVGTVYLDTGGCMGPMESGPVGADGTVTLTHTFTTAYDYSLNACFFPDDYDEYQSSADYSSYPVTDPPPTSPPVVTTHPHPRTVVVGQQAWFTAAATGQPAPTVQWQRSTNGGGTWTNVTGATTTTLKVTTTAASNGTLYRAVFTNSAGTARSRAAMLLVTQSFRGYKVPTAGAAVKRGSTVLVKFGLGDRYGAALSDWAAKQVPTAVQLWSSKPGIYASAPCTYNTTTNLFGCYLKTSSTLATGTYYLASLTRLGSGPWVAALAVGSAKNPQWLSVVR